MAKSKETKTHFEQVPLEIVKQIADEEIWSHEVNGADVTVGPPAKNEQYFRLWQATVAAGQHPSHGRREGGLKVDEHRERLRELGKPASNHQAPEEIMKLSAEKFF